MDAGPVRRRLFVDSLARAACTLAVVVAVIPLVSVLAYVVLRGAGSLDVNFFTKLPRPVGEQGGGMANAIAGTLELLALGCLGAVPVGILAGVHLAEARGGRFAQAVRLGADVLSGTPSIVVGIFAYAIVVKPMHRFSALAGAVALGVLMLPTIVRATEELLRMVPDSLREASLALGVPQWRTALKVVVRTAGPGIATAVMLAVARGAGETAPLLFTALGNQYWSKGLDQPTASLPVQIYTYAVSPYDDWQRQAWAAALVLVTLVLVLNLGARLLARSRVA